MEHLDLSFLTIRDDVDPVERMRAEMARGFELVPEPTMEEKRLVNTLFKSKFTQLNKLCLNGNKEWFKN